MASWGGTSGLGILFEYDIIGNNCIKKIDFSGITNGSQPCSSLLQVSNGNLFGMTVNGGIHGKGILFQYSTTSNTLLKKFDFDSINGSGPTGNLIEIDLTVTKVKENVILNNLNLYPNPNNGAFTIDLKTKSQIVIANTLGETILSQLLETGKQTLNIQNQTNGIYFVKITDANGLSATKKVVVNK